MLRSSSKAPSKPRKGESSGKGPAKSTSSSTKQRPKRKRVATKKKEDDASEAVSSHGSSSRHGKAKSDKYEYTNNLQAMKPPPLPYIDGVHSLSSSEIQSDLRHIQAFSSKAQKQTKATHVHYDTTPTTVHVTTAVHPGSVFHHEIPAAMVESRRSRASRVITPEEVVATLPAARQAVRLTQRELLSLKRERDDLERSYMQLRTTYISQLSDMRTKQKQQKRACQKLYRELKDKASELETSRRRTTALQDIMTELEARGNTILSLRRDNNRLEAMLKRGGMAVPDANQLCINDWVHTPFGRGIVHDMNDHDRTVHVRLENGEDAFVQEEDVEVLNMEVGYDRREQELRQQLFDKLGALYPDEKQEESESSESSEDSESEEERMIQFQSRKRKFDMFGVKKKKIKVEYRACSLPTTPYDTNLLLSPLSELPDWAVGMGKTVGDVQWLRQQRPEEMGELEKERMEKRQLQGELERMQYQLEQAEKDKEAAQEHASEQKASIDTLVTKMKKLQRKVSDYQSSSSPSRGKSKSGSTRSTRRS